MDSKIWRQTLPTCRLGPYRRNNAVLYLSTASRRCRQGNFIVVMGYISFLREFIVKEIRKFYHLVVAKILLYFSCPYVPFEICP